MFQFHEIADLKRAIPAFYGADKRRAFLYDLVSALIDSRLGRLLPHPVQTVKGFATSRKTPSGATVRRKVMRYRIERIRAGPALTARMISAGARTRVRLAETRTQGSTPTRRNYAAS